MEQDHDTKPAVVPDNQGDSSAEWRAYREESQERKVRTRQASADMLTQANIHFTSKNEGAHLIVRAGGVVVDFWPSTGRWIARKNTKGFGVQSLIDWLRSMNLVTPRELDAPE